MSRILNPILDSNHVFMSVNFIFFDVLKNSWQWGVAIHSPRLTEPWYCPFVICLVEGHVWTLWHVESTQKLIENMWSRWPMVIEYQACVQTILFDNSHIIVCSIVFIVKIKFCCDKYKFNFILYIIMFSYPGVLSVFFAEVAFFHKNHTNVFLLLFFNKNIKK